MLRRARILRWPALALTLALGLGWFLSYRGAVWVAPAAWGRMPVLLLVNGVAQLRLDKLSSITPSPPPVGFSAAPPAGVFVFH